MQYNILILSLVLTLAACGRGGTAQDGAAEQRARAAVTLTHARQGSIGQTLSWPATTVYQDKAVVSAQVSGFLTGMHVQPGTRVQAGQRICDIETKERRALGDAADGGIVSVRAVRSGVVLDVQRQAGDYVAEGTALCTVAEAGSLVFEVNVPFEQRRYVRSGSRLTIQLPDGTHLAATASQPLAAMDAGSQSVRVIARARTSFLPEGLCAKAVVSVPQANGGRDLVLPKSAVQSDETLTAYWVMRLNASGKTVERVPVEVVAHNADEVEVSAPALSPRDRVVLTGGYGLEDGGEVTVTKQ